MSYAGVCIIVVFCGEFMNFVCWLTVLCVLVSFGYCLMWRFFCFFFLFCRRVFGIDGCFRWF